MDDFRKYATKHLELYNFSLIDILIYACYSTNRTRERKKDQEIDRRSSDRFRNSPVVAGGQKVRGIERHRHMFNRKGEMTYVIT
jgi:hypothetical protein